jgi:2-dehydropantoate 2-reductase
VLFLYAMKIAVVGCGAVGSFYGAKLARAGQEVHFLLRSDYEAVRRNGVIIKSAQGDFNVRPRCAKAPEQIGPSDLVMIALKATANDRFPKLLPPLVSQNTAVLTLQNGLGNEEALAELFSKEQIMGGLCFVCLNRIGPGVIRHMDHGQIVMGEFKRWPEPRTHDIASMFRDAGVPCKVTANLAQSHWEKLVWNIPFNGLGVASAAGYEAFAYQEMPPLLSRSSNCLSTDLLLADPRWAELVKDLMLEVISAANRLGFEIPPALADKQIERTRTMAGYIASTVIDFERGLPIELNALFLEPLRLAQKSGTPTPRLQRLGEILSLLTRT